MAQSQTEFDQRLQRLDRKHRAMINGYSTVMRPDGLIVAKARRAKRQISLKPVILFIAAFFVFKGFLVANLGPETYADRLGRLQEGTVVEKAGALVMQNDPLTSLIAQKVGPYLR